MNTSEVPHGTWPPVTPSFTAETLWLPEDVLRGHRMNLYHSSGDGYVVFRQFLSPAAVAHVRSIWSNTDAAKAHAVFADKGQFQPGCPNFVEIHPDGSRVFHNFVWNAPFDEVTQEASICAHMLRNRLSGRNAFAELLPGGAKALNYRVIIARNQVAPVLPHRDYFNYDRRLEKNQYDLSRLQATLVLSDLGTDYEGSGFRFERNDGSFLVFGRDAPIAGGDLLIWRYVNLHSVEEVRSSTEQFGFMRIILPPEEMLPLDSEGSSHSAPTARNTLQRVLRRPGYYARRAPGALFRRVTKRLVGSK